MDWRMKQVLALSAVVLANATRKRGPIFTGMQFSKDDL